MGTAAGARANCCRWCYRATNAAFCLWTELRAAMGSTMRHTMTFIFFELAMPTSWPTHEPLALSQIGPIELQSDCSCRCAHPKMRGVSRPIQTKSVECARQQASFTAANSRAAPRATEAIKGQPPQQRQNEGLPVGPRAPVLYEGSDAGLPRAGARGTP